MTAKTKDSLLDRMIFAASPRWYAERQAWREVGASYRGGVQTRLDRPWFNSTSRVGGSALDRRMLGSMRDRARNVYRENPIGRSIVQTEVDNVIAEGMTLQAATSNRDFNKLVESRFAYWADHADVRGLLPWSAFQRMVYLTSRVDGDCGVVLVDRGGDSRLQLIPGDLIRNPNGRGGEPNLYDGIESNDVGAPKAFHVLSVDGQGKQDFTRIAASNFRYLAHIREPMQIRGETCFAQVFGYLNKLDEYVDAVTVAARMAAIFGLVFKESTGSKQFNGLPTLANSKGEQQKALTLENGMAKYIGQGDDIVQVQAQQPMQQTPEFIAAILRLIGLPFDMPLELTLKDFSRVNFSSARAAFVNYWRACRSRQAWFKSRFLSPVYQWWLSREVAMGNIVVPDEIRQTYWDHEFRPRGWQWVDPVSEPQAALLEIDMGINSPQNIVAEHGGDWDDIQEQLAAARRTRAEYELPDSRSTLTRDSMTNASAQPASDPIAPDETITGTPNE